MANDREHTQHQQPGTGNAENPGGSGRKEQFNELSELSLEERMKVADQIGIPVNNVSDAAATGTMSGLDNAAGGSTDRMEEESTGGKTER